MKGSKKTSYGICDDGSRRKSPLSNGIDTTNKAWR